MPQFFIDKNLSEGAEVEIRGADAHHIASVLRLAAGDWLILSDGEGRSFRSTITEVKSRLVRARIEEIIQRRAGHTPPVLAIAAIRSERLEWAVQKCVELGCQRTIPFHSERTVRKGEKIKRLERIALEAAKQSGLPALPRIDAPIEFSELCGMLGDFSPAIMLYEGERERSLKDALEGRPSDRESLVIVGPEGGFTSDEVEMARERGALTASIGSQILRVETAAVAAMAILQYELGNMSAP
jgi:16S rRNA (uracil1498-N3)-methyltransferase